MVKLLALGVGWAGWDRGHGCSPVVTAMLSVPTSCVHFHVSPHPDQNKGVKEISTAENVHRILNRNCQMLYMDTFLTFDFEFVSF